MTVALGCIDEGAEALLPGSGFQSQASGEAWRCLRTRLAGLCVGLLGQGVSGCAMASWLCQAGATVWVADERADGLDPRLVGSGARFFSKAQLPDAWLKIDGLLLSPGWDPKHPWVAALAAARIPVGGELDLVGQLPGKVVAITGTNGKSTTTLLVHAMAQALGKRSFAGGNLGPAMCAHLDEATQADVAVLELSSYQLETGGGFEADVGVMLNIRADHAERYTSFAKYCEAKARMWDRLVVRGQNTTGNPLGVAVLCVDDLCVAEMAKALPAEMPRRLIFSDVSMYDEMALLADRDDVCVTYVKKSGDAVFLGDMACLGEIDLTHAHLQGRHQHLNAMAALWACHGAGLWCDRAGLDVALGAWHGFAGMAHRLQWVGAVDGVDFINDSKATNDAAAAAAVLALKQPMVLLLGGRSKGGGWPELLAACGDRVRAVCAFGEAEAEIVAAFAEHVPSYRCGSMEQACVKAHALAQAGDAVLLAPGCASQDAFVHYAARGDAFVAWVLGK